MTQGKKNRLFFLFGLADITVGICGILFCFFSGFLSEGFRFFILFGSEFWAYIALPLMILACGIIIVANVGNRSVFSTFVSLISAIYLFASIFSTTPPAFIDAVKVSTLTLDVCRIYLPVAGLVFFLFQILVSFLNRKGPENSSLQNT